MCIVQLKNSGDIIERSTIGSIKAFVDESERESARSVCGGIWLPWFFSSSSGSDHSQTVIAFKFDVHFSLTANVGSETAAAWP